MLGLNIVETLLKSAPYRKCKTFANHGFSVISMVTVPAIAGMAIYWGLQNPSHIKVMASSNFAVNAQAGSITRVSSQVRMQAVGHQVAYRLKLVDDTGDVKYTYPNVVIGDDQLKLDEVKIKLPDTIQPGAYSLVADMEYLINPIKSNSMQIELAHIEIGVSDK